MCPQGLCTPPPKLALTQALRGAHLSPPEAVPRLSPPFLECDLFCPLWKTKPSLCATLGGRTAREAAGQLVQPSLSWGFQLQGLGAS